MKNGLFIFICTLALLSCSKQNEQPEESKVSIKLPTKKQLYEKYMMTRRYAQSKNQLVTGAWGETASTIADYNCLAIIAEWDSPIPDNCTDNSDQQVAKVNLGTGTFPLGATIEMFVPSGPQRRFKIVGIKKSAGMANCPAFFNFDSTVKAQISQPHILGETVKDLILPDENVSINISVAGSKEIKHCSGGPFNWSAPASDSGVTIASGNLINDEFVLSGSSMDSVTSILFDDSGTQTALNIISATATELRVQATAALNLLFNATYNLIINTASGQSIVPINVTQSFVFEAQSSAFTINTATDAGKIFLVSGATDVTLPPAATSSNFHVRVKRVGASSEVKIIPNGSDNINGFNTPLIPVEKNSLVHMISDGSEWHLLAITGDFVRGDPSSVNCNGDGTGAGNCYASTTAQTAGVANNGGTGVFWNGQHWAKISNPNSILINDSNTQMTTEYTNNKNFATLGAKNIIGEAFSNNAGNGIFYTHDLGYLTMSTEFGVLNHTEASQNQDYINNNMNSTNVCSVRGMRLPRLDQTTYADATNGVPAVINNNNTPESTWTATVDNSNNSSYFCSWQGNNSNCFETPTNSKRTLCVIYENSL